MNKQISFRYQQIGDAKRFLEILNSPEFIYFPSPPNTIKAEKAFLRKCIEQRRQGKRYAYTILFNGKIIGSIGMYIMYRSHCGEIGYFVNPAYWGRGIARKKLSLGDTYVDSYVYAKVNEHHKQEQHGESL